MDFAEPVLSRVANVETGKLFVLVNEGRKNAVCLKAAYDPSDEDEDEPDRVLPLWWPDNEQSVGVAIYARSLPGEAVVLEGALVEVNPLSATTGSIGSIANVYARDSRLYFPHSYQGRFSGLVDAGTGIILPSVRGGFVGFTDWRITVPWEANNRRVIIPVG